MASKALLCVILLGGFHPFVAAPAIDKTHPQPSPGLVSRSGWDSQAALSPQNLHADFIDSLLIAPPAEPTTETASTNNMPDYPFSFPFVSDPSTTSAEPIITVTVTQEEYTTITESASPTTLTEFVTITYIASTSSESSPIPIPSPSPEGTGLAKATWVAPEDYSDLDSFQISRFSGGQRNINIVTGIPAEASAIAVSSKGSKSNESPASPIPWDNTTTVMQLFYPEGSIDPAQKPQGGADFYATPLDINDANNVTLQYSVFFPSDFDWVLAGKLPGMYGGHTGCSGGNAAIDCFSTRLMWRQEGAGELYLYAPKDKQTKELCDDPQSDCDAAYGLSVGRGSFKWAAGSWTTIRQTINLNTPGQQDGTFVLDVNGERIIERNDVYYRADLSDGNPLATHTPTKTSKQHRPKPTHTAAPPDDDPIGGLLGGLGNILGNLRRDSATAGKDALVKKLTTVKDKAGPRSQSMVLRAREPTSNGNPPTMTPREDSDDNAFGTEAAKETEVKLIGIFFSTFFGGHEDKYATPRDQYVWFKDFVLSYNS